MTLDQVPSPPYAEATEGEAGTAAGGTHPGLLRTGGQKKGPGNHWNNQDSWKILIIFSEMSYTQKGNEPMTTRHWLEW